jgi:hypothetical protein
LDGAHAGRRLVRFFLGRCSVAPEPGVVASSGVSTYDQSSVVIKKAQFAAAQLVSMVRLSALTLGLIHALSLTLTP